VSLRVLASKLN